MRIKFEKLTAILLAAVFVVSGLNVSGVMTAYAAEVTEEVQSTATIEEQMSEDGAQEQVSEEVTQEQASAEETETATEDIQEEADVEDTEEEVQDGNEVDYSNIILTGEELCEPGVKIEGVDVGGLTYEEAQSAIREELKKRLANEVKIKISKDEYIYTFGDLGVSYSEGIIEDALMGAVVYGNHGTLMTEYKERSTLSNKGKDFIIDSTVDENKINQTVTELANKYTEQVPKNAEVHRVSGEFVFTEEVNGVGVNIKDTVSGLLDKVTSWKSGNIEVSANVEETIPDITMAEIGVIKDLLGSCRTSFADNLGYGRGVNLRNGTSKIDDVVLMPGETLSVHDRLSPFTKENGYQTATAYANGAYVDSIGGGICQISTTLYNAALKAELEVVKRSNHSMTVGYVDYAFDAAVNDNGSKDLVIKNNLDHPIYIESYLLNMQVCVYIYGLETRDPNRVVEYYSEVLEEIYPGEDAYQYIEVAPGHPQYSPENGFLEEELVGPDEILQIQGNYPTCRAKLYKRVTVNGVVVEDTCLHTDKYRSSPAKFLVGANYPYPGNIVETTAASTEGSTGTSTESGTTPPTEGSTVAPTQAPNQAPTQAPTEAATQPPAEVPTEAPSTEASGE